MGLLWTGLGRSWKRAGSLYSCYEAGASGYWLHRELVELGVKNLVVAPKAMGGAEAKRQKTDKRDSAQLCDGLDRYLRGQDQALSVVAVPTLTSPDPLPSSDYKGSHSSRSSRQRVAVYSRHRSWRPMVGG